MRAIEAMRSSKVNLNQVFKGIEDDSLIGGNNGVKDSLFQSRKENNNIVNIEGGIVFNLALFNINLCARDNSNVRGDH